MPLPLPFPLASGQYEVRPDLRRFGQAGQGMEAESGHFRPDELLGEVLAAKLAALRQGASECHLVAPGLDPGNAPDGAEGLAAALRACFRLLAEEQPELACLEADGVRLAHLGLRVLGWTGPDPRVEPAGEPRADLREVAAGIRTWLEGRRGIWLLGDALGLSVQEDLAIVRGPRPTPPAETDLLEWVHICLPSNWAPAEKIGHPFAAVHGPVANNAQLLAASGQVVRAMIHAGPFIRHVWGIDRDGAWCHNPRLHQSPPWGEDPAGQAFFRVERQTTHGFADLNRALFTIRYFVAPLPEVAADPWRRERLVSALKGMNDQALAYKGLTQARDRLVSALERWPHPWRDLIFALAAELDRAAIPYSFEAATALLIQGLEAPGMDDIDLSVQWGRLESARALFAQYGPTPIQNHGAWAAFRFEREGVPVDILSYCGTVMSSDPDRLEADYDGQKLWCKSLAFFHRHSPPGHPRRAQIERFWSDRG